MVSLALVLLVFFLALISLSNFDRQRQDTAMSSLHSTFLAGRPGGVSDFSGLTGDLVLPRRSFQQTLSDLFETEIPAARVQRGVTSDVTTAEFPAEALFFPGRSELRPPRLRFFDGIIAALAAAPEGVVFKVEILVATDYDSSKMGSTASKLAQSRVSSVAQVMAERGAAPGSFAVGVQEGMVATGYAERQVTMTFRAIPGVFDGGDSDHQGASRGGVRGTQAQ
jgi:hypothetical protein